MLKNSTLAPIVAAEPLKRRAIFIEGSAKLIFPDTFAWLAEKDFLQELYLKHTDKNVLI